MNYNGKRVVIKMVYRILNTSSNEIHYSLTQYNTMEGKAKALSEYRSEVLDKIKAYMIVNNKINDVIITGDFNQSIASNEIQRFYKEIRVYDAYSYFNNILINELDKTYINRSTPIDSIAVISGLLEYVEGCKLLSYNVIVFLDYCAYIVDINFQEYFNEQLSQ